MSRIIDEFLCDDNHFFLNESYLSDEIARSSATTADPSATTADSSLKSGNLSLKSRDSSLKSGNSSEQSGYPSDKNGRLRAANGWLHRVEGLCLLSFSQYLPAAERFRYFRSFPRAKALGNLRTRFAPSQALPPR